MEYTWSIYGVSMAYPFCIPSRFLPSDCLFLPFSGIFPISILWFISNSKRRMYYSGNAVSKFFFLGFIVFLMVSDRFIMNSSETIRIYQKRLQINLETGIAMLYVCLSCWS
jgi:hypothetical protein